jgi:hypothetical protein
VNQWTTGSWPEMVGLLVTSPWYSGELRGVAKRGSREEVPVFSSAVTNRLYIKNLYATILKKIELDLNHLNYFYGGLASKLVGVEGSEPIHEILA